MTTWTRSRYLPQERGYHVNVIWQYAVRHQRMISGAQYKDYKIDWTRHEFAGWAGRHHSDDRDHSQLASESSSWTLVWNAMANLPHLISTIICILG